MGGNALKNTKTIRLPAGQYYLLVERIVKIVRQMLPEGTRVEIIPAYREKADFGDADILIANNPNVGSCLEQVVQRFSPNEVVRNGPVLSFDVDCFQVDFIRVPDETFDFSCNYFSFNDLGNLVGRIAHKMGFKFGHEGLRYVVRDGTHVFDEILVTKDFDPALRFLGYDPYRFHQGFETLEDIFRYTASTYRFNRQIYLLENRNHASRTRDRKRPTYRAFLEYCNKLPQVTEYAFNTDKSIYLSEAFVLFPGFQARYDDVLARFERRCEFRRRFNGRKVGNWLNMEGPELGRALKAIKVRMGGERELESFVLGASEETLKTKVLEIAARAGKT